MVYAALGWHVIPLKPGTKEAAIEWRNGLVNYQEVAPTPDELYKWFNEFTVQKRKYVLRDGVSIPTDQFEDYRYTEPVGMGVILRSKTVGLDFDSKVWPEGGYLYWLEQYPALAQLPRVRTASGAVHVYFGITNPMQQYDIHLPDGKDGVIEVRTGPNIDVLPPTVLANGKQYEWEVPLPASGLPVIDPETVGVKARPKLTVVGREYHEGDPLSEGEIDAVVEAVTPSWTPNHRHALSLAVPGWLASIGAPEEDARTVVSRLGEGDGSRAGEFQRSVRDTYVKAARGESTKGWSELRDTLAADQLRLLRQVADAHTPTFTLTAKVKGVTIPWAIDLADFLSLDFPPDAWLVDGLIEDVQLGMIAGEPGVQKSWLSLYLALCVALGEPFFGTYYIEERKPVVYIQEENSPKKLNRRIARLLKWMGYTKDDIRGWFTLITNQSFRIDKPEVMQKLADEVLTPKQPALVIFDPMVEMHHKKENDNDEMTPLMEALRQIRNHYECVVILVHHVNKATEMENFINRIRGASSITGAVDFGIGLVKKKEEEEKSTVFWWKIRDDKKPAPFAVELIDQEDGSIRFAMYDGAAVTKRAGYAEVDVLDAIKFLGRANGESIARHMGLALKDDKYPPSKLSNMLNVLAGQKQMLDVVTTTEGKFYSLK